MIAHQTLLSLLKYDPVLGHFTWAVSRGRVSSGQRAGCPGAHGYRQLRVDGRIYYEHRLAWFYVHEQWPSEIDHKNEVKDDNRIENLREATRGENLQNRTSPNKGNTSGYLGVSWNSSRQCYVAAIRVKGMVHKLGEFSDPVVASEAYYAAKRQFHPFFISSRISS